MSLFKVGLTGGIGSGKSTVASMFAALAVPVLDLDQVGRDVVAPGSMGLQQLIDTFGVSIVDSEGLLNRSALARHCFADAHETDKLNAIMHPLIWQAEKRWLAQQDAAYAVIEASVLLESGGAGRMDIVLVVLADEQLRCDRVLLRGDRNRQQFGAIIARQCSDAERRKSADMIIENNNDFDTLKLQVLETHELLLKASKEK